MVILYSKEGQLANRLWQAAHFVANANEYQYKLLHLGFSDYREHFRESFSELEKKSSCRIINENGLSLLEKILFLYIKVSQKIEQRTKRQLPFIKKVLFLEFSAKKYSIAQPSFLELSKKNIVLVDGWFFDDKKSLEKHADFIRNAFNPNLVYKRNIEILKEKQFALYDLVVGVHVRRGDYKKYMNGKWFYSDEEYANFMNKVLTLKLFHQKKVGFLLCSDEEVNYDLFQEFNIIISTRNFIEDLYTLSECNCIIGPPSTYSAWASFYGKTPLLHLIDKDVVIQEDLFKVVDVGFC